MIGAGFAILVILVFLLSLRSTLVTAVSIPLSIVIALIGLWAGQFSLNILTLGGLTIAIGRVVDDSIVVLENIQRHLRQDTGAEKLSTITGAVREVAGAVTASTLTTVSVFLPIAFTGGFVGQLFSSFAVTVTIALLASLFVALTIIPVLAYWFLKAPKAQKASARQTSRARANDAAGTRVCTAGALGDNPSPDQHSRRAAHLFRFDFPGAAPGNQLFQQFQPEHLHDHANPAGKHQPATNRPGGQAG